MVLSKGWKPLPTTLKAVFVVLALGVLYFLVTRLFLALFSLLPSMNILSIIWSMAVVGATIVFLVALWNRNSWAWEYGLILFGVGILARIVNLILLPKRIAELGSQIQASTAFLYIGPVIGILFGLTVSILFLVFIYKQKDYFKRA